MGVVIGLYADEAIMRFTPAQWVNVWDTFSPGFVCEAQMNCLPEEVLEDPESYFLEPTEEDGSPISLKEALRRTAQQDSILVISLARREEENTWVACFPTGAKAPGSEKTVEELFGSSVIPTAFPATAPADVVLAEIRRLNPGFEVRCA